MSPADGRSKLIYDVGVGNGDDSAYYLNAGFRVVGIEASPTAVANLRTRFADEIGAGTYVLLPVGIAETSGKAAFWVCDDHSPWSSFDRGIASRGGARHHCEMVETRPFGSVLEEFGAAAYCKIDIEGHDNQCLRAFAPETRPPHVSVELIDGDEQLRLLRGKGYSRFKIISQRSFRQPSEALLRITSAPSPILRRAISTFSGRLMRYQPDPGWRFPAGSSGPFGERTQGPWRNFDEALQTWRLIERIEGPVFDWHDIHASLEELMPAETRLH